VSGPRATPLERWQRISLTVAGVACLLAFLTAGGCSPLPEGPPAAAAWFHPFFLVLGIAAGVASVLRFREIDHHRWEVVGDPHLTKGEREWAHKEAERQRRFAASAYLAAPLGLSFWLAYQFQGRFQLPDVSPADVLMLTPLLGFFAGLLWAQRRFKADSNSQ
jgi:hypothetical protein